MSLHTEIEGKWLLSERPRLKGRNGVKIAQGYLIITPDEEVRIRQMGRDFFFAVKSGHGLVRRETEIKLSESQFQALWPATLGKRITKTRYSVKIGAFLGELDVYSGANKGLFTVEVEFRTVAEYKHFVPPAWFRKEVTCNAKFKNKSLALHPLNSSLL